MSFTVGNVNFKCCLFKRVGLKRRFFVSFFLLFDDKMISTLSLTDIIVKGNDGVRACSNELYSDSIATAR